MRILRNKKWQNTIKKYSGEIPYYAIPHTLSDVVNLVQRAENEGKRIKAVGSGHSYSDVAVPETYLVDLKKLDALLSLDKEQIRPEFHAKKLVRVESGMTVQKFNKRMDSLDLCVPNMGGIDNQTLAGAISTGTHGTGLNLPSFPGLVRSMLLVTTGGKCLRIEPENGVTNPDKYNESNVELVQDNPTFYSAVLNLGCFGIIYSYILELLPMYYLEETKKCYNWSEVKPQLEDRSLFNYPDGTPVRGVMVQVNPYKNEDGDHTCIVVRHRLLNTKPARSIGDATRNWMSSILSRLPISYWVIKRITRKNAKKLPKMLDTSLKSLKDKRYENKGYKVLYQGAEFIKNRAYASEFAFDMTGDKNDFISALEEMFEKAEENQTKGLYQSAPMGLRFVDASPVYLSAEYGKKVAYIDTPFIIGTPKLDEILFEYQEIMFKHNGIPHWGKINTILNGRSEVLHNYYPKLDTWQDFFKKFNSKKIFSNKFSDRLNLGFIERLV